MRRFPKVLLSKAPAAGDYPVTGTLKEIVVVEDDLGMREALENVLGAAGFRVSTFDSAESLLAQGAPPESGCWVFDIRLPGASGLELYRALEARGPTPPVIFITAFDEPSVREETERLGASGYLLKPFRGKLLVECVTEALGVGTNH